MNFTLDSINRERELEKENKKESKEDIKKIKFWVLGLVGTIISTLIITTVKMIFGL